MDHKIIEKVTQELCRPESMSLLPSRSNRDYPLPSVDALAQIMETLRAVIFPGYFGPSDLRPSNMQYHIGSMLDRVYPQLREQILRGCRFMCDKGGDCGDCDDAATKAANGFIAEMPAIREALTKDVQAAYEGDPAAKNTGEAVFCYPSIQAMIHYRAAHALHRKGVPLIPRIITEMAHSATGIDIHPGAEIGEYFFMDHGTGIVIGETGVIGTHVVIYQGVTLGAKSFPKDEHGNPIKGIPRHPIVEDNVTIYSGATILGRITIGRGAVIGGNVWVTSDVPPGGRVLQGRPRELELQGGAGI